MPYCQKYITEFNISSGGLEDFDKYGNSLNRQPSKLRKKTITGCDSFRSPRSKEALHTCQNNSYWTVIKSWTYFGRVVRWIVQFFVGQIRPQHSGSLASSWTPRHCGRSPVLQLRAAVKTAGLPTNTWTPIFTDLRQIMNQ